MPLTPIVPSLLLYVELTYSQLIDLNEKYPQFLYECLTKTGYSTLHLMPKAANDTFTEFDSWPKIDRDFIYYKMTQRREFAPTKLLNEWGVSVNLEKGAINVIKFENVDDFLREAENLSKTPECCFTVLYIVNEADELVKECKSFIDFQESLSLAPSALINCPNPDWTRLAVSFSKGCEGEFRVRPEAYQQFPDGLFELKRWRGFPGGITQLYSLKAELSSTIGVTGKYGD